MTFNTKKDSLQFNSIADTLAKEQLSSFSTQHKVDSEMQLNHSEMQLNHSNIPLQIMQWNTDSKNGYFELLGPSFVARA